MHLFQVFHVISMHLFKVYILNTCFRCIFVYFANRHTHISSVYLTHQNKGTTQTNTRKKRGYNMKQTTNMSRVIGEIQSIGRKVNKYWFNNELDMERVIFVVSSTPKAYGHFTPFTMLYILILCMSLSQVKMQNTGNSIKSAANCMISS